MTAEQIHDALTLLPTDLIAETDRLRSRKPKVIRWKRYAAMAACFALVLCSSLYCMLLFGASGGSKEQAALEAPAAMQAEANLAPQEAAPADAAGDILCGLPTDPVIEEHAAEEIQADTTSKNTSAAAGTLSPGISQPKYMEAIPGAATACFAGNPAPKLFRSRGDLESHWENSIRFDWKNLQEDCEGYDDAWFEEHDLVLISLCGVPVDDRAEVTAIRENDGKWEICVENYYASTETERCSWHVLIETEKGLIASEDDIVLIFE